jgi:hypothetical protein
MKIHTITTEDPAEVCMVRKFITDFETHNTRPGFIKSTDRSGKTLNLAFEYTELDVSDNEAMATEEYGSISGILVSRFRKFCEAHGFELKFGIPG